MSKMMSEMKRIDELNQSFDLKEISLVNKNSLFGADKSIILGVVGKESDYGTTVPALDTLMLWIVGENISVVKDGILRLNIARVDLKFPRGIKESIALANLQNLDVLSSKELEHYDAKQFLLIDRYQLGNLIFIEKGLNEEEAQKFLNKKLHEVISKFLPLPVEEEWGKDFFNKFKGRFLKKLYMFGNVPFSEVYELDLDIDKYETQIEIEKMLVESYTKHNYEKLYKRAPRFTPLLYMIDERNFNMKSWGKFLNDLTGEKNPQKAIEKINSNFNESQKIWLVHCYEFFGEFAYEVFKELSKKMDAFSVDIKTPNIEVFKKGIKKNKNLMFKNFKNFILGDNIFPSLNIINGLFTLLPKFNKEVKRDELLKDLASFKYKVRRGAEGIAMVAAELMISEAAFEDYQEAYLKNIKNAMYSSRRYPTINGMLNKDYSWEAIDATNPRSWFVGLETNCCQHLHSAGASCVMYMAENPETSGIFRVMKKGKTIAQSWFWFDPNTGDFVFDNIEVLGREVRDSIMECYLQYVEELRRYAPIFGIRRVTVGLGYNDMSGLEKFPKVSNPTHMKGSVYSDAYEQILLADFSKEIEDFEKKVNNLKKELNNK